MRASVLLSYHFWRGQNVADELAKFDERPVMFADSGAFSASTIGATIDVDDYAAWLDRWRPWVDVACTLDVIGSAEGTWENTKRLEAHGHHVLPVFHIGEEWEWLERWCASYRYVGLGGQVPWSSQADKVRRWRIRCFQIARPHGTVFHGLGQTNPETLAALPFYSVDSSAWVSGDRFGSIMLWDEAVCRLRTLHLSDSPQRLHAHGSLLRAHGLDPAVLHSSPFFGRRDPEHTKAMELVRAERSALQRANLQAWFSLQSWWQRRHGPIATPGMPDGPWVFLVCSNADVLAGVRAVVDQPAPIGA